MKINTINDEFSVCGQITTQDVKTIAQKGFKTIICNRPDGESEEQTAFTSIQDEAKKNDLSFLYLPVISGQITKEDVILFKKNVSQLPKPILSYCRSGTRSMILWSLAQDTEKSEQTIESTCGNKKIEPKKINVHYDIVIIGGGCAGITVAAHLLNQKPDLNIAMIEPSSTHYYQSGFSLVGLGMLPTEAVVHDMNELIPKQVKWLKMHAVAFKPKENLVLLEKCFIIRYQYLIVCPGLKMNWRTIPGLEETLGKNGVTSNYRYDLAPYTWKLLQTIQSGNCIFYQPHQPIKCSIEAQQMMIMAANYWNHKNKIKNLNLEFYMNNKMLPTLPRSNSFINNIQEIPAQIHSQQFLIKVDGNRQKVWFKNPVVGTITEVNFNLLYIIPPQIAPDFIRISLLADKNGWMDVDPYTLQHKNFCNVYGLGDVINTPNEKSIFAIEKQSKIVADNILYDMGQLSEKALYDGYGAYLCMLKQTETMLTEYNYAKETTNNLPSTLGCHINQCTALSNYRNKELLPMIYWDYILKNKAWLHEIK